MSVSKLPSLSLNGIAPSTYTSKNGAEYLQLDNTVLLDGKLFKVYTSDVYEKVRTSDGRETSVKRTVLRLKAVNAEAPKTFAAGPTKVTDKAVSKANAVSGSQGPDMQAIVAAVVAALQAQK